jgi:ubiquinone/menaquinone biosynthesis C-methylase UbiE
MGAQRPEASGREAVAAYYNDRARPGALAALYAAATPLGRLYRVRMNLILALLAPCPGGTLLDIGCGTGQMLRFLEERRPGDFVSTGLDESASMLEQAGKVVGDRVRLVTGRAERLPIEDGAFDVALAMGVYEYVQDVGAAVRELARVLRPEGLAIVTMQNRWSPYRLWDSAVYRHVRRLREGPVSPIVSRVGERRLRALLAAAGLSPVDVVYYDFNIFPAPLDTRLPRAAMRVADRLEHVGRGPLRRLGTGFIVSARKPQPGAG